MADDDLALVLRLLHDSGRRWRTARAEGQDWIDDERAREAFVRSAPPGSVRTVRGVPDAADRDPSWKVWLRQPGQARVDLGGPRGRRTLVITDGERTCVSQPDGGYRTGHTGSGLGGSPGPTSIFLRPHVLPALFRLEVVGDGALLGRDVIRVRGRARTEAEPWPPSVTTGADEVEFAVDAERAVLLLLAARREGRAFRRVTVTSVAFDEEMDDALFASPPTSRGSVPPVAPDGGRVGAARRQFGPPDDVLGVPVGEPQVLARAPTVVVALDRVTAYPDGFEIGVSARLRRDAGETPSVAELHRRAWSGTSPFPGESLRIGVVFADGRRRVAENFRPGRGPAEHSDIQLRALRGGGSPYHYDQWFWVAPLPPPGPLGIIVEWPGQGLAETRVDLDGARIADAGSRAERLWP